MRRMQLASAVAFGAMLLSSPAFAVTFTEDTGPGDGSISQSAPSPLDFILSITGNDNDAYTDVSVQATATAAFNLIVTYTADYETMDEDGPGYDRFGYLIDGTTFQLSDSSGADTQTLSGSFAVASGSVWGFYVFSGDGDQGAASVDVTGSIAAAAVPAPASLLLLSGALGGLALRGRRKG